MGLCFPGQPFHQLLASKMNGRKIEVSLSASGPLSTQPETLKVVLKWFYFLPLVPPPVSLLWRIWYIFFSFQKAKAKWLLCCKGLMPLCKATTVCFTEGLRWEEKLLANWTNRVVRDPPLIFLNMKIVPRLLAVRPAAIIYDSFEESWDEKTVCVGAVSLRLNLVGELTQCEVIWWCSYFKDKSWTRAHSPDESRFASGEFRPCVWELISRAHNCQEEKATWLKKKKSTQIHKDDKVTPK